MSVPPFFNVSRKLIILSALMRHFFLINSIAYHDIVLWAGRVMKVTNRRASQWRE
jgi:hypothetical protein